MVRGAQVASFRDPSGRVFVLDDRVVRIVHDEGRPALEAFLHSDTIREAMADGRVVGTHTLTGHDADEALAAMGDVGPTTERGADGDVPVVLEHDRVPFPSYPYEWAPEMLAAAGRLMLDLQDGLVAEGRGLKDATPYNVLFDGPRPVFIDALSVEAREPTDPVWNPFGQFIRTFLLPLLVQRDLGVPLADTFLAHRDGLEPERVHRMTPRLRRLRPTYLSLVSLPTWLASKAEAKGAALYEAKRVKSAEHARFVLDAVARRLRRRVMRLAPHGNERSDWSEYMQNRGHYAGADAEAKELFVGEALADQRPEWVLDVGCNTGHFSRLAAEHGARVVAVDLDPVSVGRVFRAAEAEGLDILPLVVNLSRPTPAVGWRNAECPSFLDRADNRFDMAFFLAVMHHLHVTERVPLAEIVDLAAHVSRRHVVFEYVGPDDPMFRLLLRGRGHLHQDLTREAFEAAATRRFDILAAKPLDNADRVLYLLERRPDTEVAASTVATSEAVTGHGPAARAGDALLAPAPTVAAVEAS